MPATDPSFDNLLATLAEISARFTEIKTTEFTAALEQITKLSASAVSISPKLEETLARLSRPLVPPDYLKNITALYSSSSLQPALSELRSYDSAWRSACEAIRASREYLSEEQEELVNEISPEILSPDPVEACSRRRLTPGEMIALLSLLATLFFGILQQITTSRQLDEISAQNEIQIEQNSREIALLQQIYDVQLELLDSLKSGQDALVETDRAVLESEDAVLEPDELVDDPVDMPESHQEADDYEDDADLQNG